jgi:ubiquitin-protein ligase
MSQMMDEESPSMDIESYDNLIVKPVISSPSLPPTSVIPNSHYPFRLQSVDHITEGSVTFASSGKRKQQWETQDTHSISNLEETIKRVKISCTPGEIRLGKDIKELKDLEGIHIELTENPASVIIIFDPMGHSINSFDCIVPSRFRIEVSRYYPHTHPKVTCLDTGCQNLFIANSGLVTHVQLTENWSPIGSLLTVIDVLRGIRGIGKA